LRVALRLTGDAHVAEDLVQETLCRVLRQWRSFRGDASFKTWMLGILMNLDRDRRRTLRAHQPLDEDVEIEMAPAPMEIAVAHEMHVAVRTAVDRLPERQREVAVLSWGEGLVAREVASVLGITEANVYTNLHLARKRLAQALGLNVAGRGLP